LPPAEVLLSRSLLSLHHKCICRLNLKILLSWLLHQFSDSADLLSSSWYDSILFFLVVSILYIIDIYLPFSLFSSNGRDSVQLVVSVCSAPSNLVPESERVL
ncbi:hypothetical protein AABB24_017155, partial [Solanum stoloniferum]